MSILNNPLNRGQGIIPEQFVKERTLYTQFQSWLGETLGIVGCPLGCKYCFFQLDGKTPAKPQAFISSQKMIEKLCEAPTYTREMPVNYGSETDVFSTKQTIAYYTELLRCYGESEYLNPVVFITKQSIPEEIMDVVVSISQPVLFYMSFYGLAGTSIEPRIDPQTIKHNFIRLKERGLLAIHYWRPFLPANSTSQIINETLEFVSNNAICSVINGLRLNDGIRDNVMSFWPELKEQQFNFSRAGEFWPQGIREYLIQRIKKDYFSYPAFFGNTSCSIAYALGKSDVYGHYSQSACQDSNCPLLQQGRCRSSYRIPTLVEVQEVAARVGVSPEDVRLDDGKIVVGNVVASGKITFMRYVLKYPVRSESVDYAAGYNWANIREEERVIEVPWRDNWTDG